MSEKQYHEEKLREVGIFVHQISNKSMTKRRKNEKSATLQGGGNGKRKYAETGFSGRLKRSDLQDETCRKGPANGA